MRQKLGITSAAFGAKCSCRRNVFGILVFILLGTSLSLGRIDYLNGPRRERDGINGNWLLAHVVHHQDRKEESDPKNGIV